MDQCEDCGATNSKAGNVRRSWFPSGFKMLCLQCASVALSDSSKEQESNDGAD